MKKRFILFTILSLMLFGMSSCGLIFVALYGIKMPKKVDEKMIFKYAEKYKVPLADCYELDTTYEAFLFSLDTIYKAQRKNHYQPLQALYYDTSEQLKSFQINCYVGGFPNLRWRRDDIFKTFPPQEQAPLDSIVPLQTQFEYIHPLSNTQEFDSKNYDYVVVVYWSRSYGRQSKRLIRFVKKNSELSGDKTVKIIYVNVDNYEYRDYEKS